MGRRREVPAFDDWVIDGSNPMASSINDPIPHKLGPLVRRAVERLNTRDRDLIFMRFYERLTYEAIAERHGFEDARGHRQRMWYWVTRALRNLKEEMAAIVTAEDRDYLEQISE